MHRTGRVSRKHFLNYLKYCNTITVKQNRKKAVTFKKEIAQYSSSIQRSCFIFYVNFPRCAI